jgi:hypothetical protein
MSGGSLKKYHISSSTTKCLNLDLKVINLLYMRAAVGSSNTVVVEIVENSSLRDRGIVNE